MPFAELIQAPGFLDLVRANYEELSLHKEDVPLFLDVPRILMLEANNIFRVWAARGGERVIGYIPWHIMPPINHGRTPTAYSGDHYLSPKYRNSEWLGVRMWRECLDALRLGGIMLVVTQDSVHRSMEPMFRRLGFELTGNHYAMVLR